jgi:hypothetical protein
LPKRLDITTSYLINSVYKGERNGAFLDTAYAGFASPDIEPKLLLSGLNAIKESFPANITQVIEMRIRDCSLLKVYDSFQFSNAPDEFAGNTYRLSYADYDFVKNEVKIRAYKIA